MCYRVKKRSFGVKLKVCGGDQIISYEFLQCELDIKCLIILKKQAPLNTTITGSKAHRTETCKCHHTN